MDAPPAKRDREAHSRQFYPLLIAAIEDVARPSLWNQLFIVDAECFILSHDELETVSVISPRSSQRACELKLTFVASCSLNDAGYSKTMNDPCSSTFEPISWILTSTQGQPFEDLLLCCHWESRFRADSSD